LKYREYARCQGGFAKKVLSQLIRDRHTDLIGQFTVRKDYRLKESMPVKIA